MSETRSVWQQVPKLRQSAPKLDLVEAFVVWVRGGSIDVAVMARSASVRPGSRNAARAHGWTA